jgi:hypothetical protein
MPLTPTAAALLLDWVNGPGTPTRPPARWFGYATSSPNASTAFEGQTNRVTVTFGPASGAPISATNMNVFAALTMSPAKTFIGWNLWDASPAGNRLMYGTFAANAGNKANSGFNMSAGSLKILLA